MFARRASLSSAGRSIAGSIASGLHNLATNSTTSSGRRTSVSSSTLGKRRRLSESGASTGGSATVKPPAGKMSGLSERQPYVKKPKKTKMKVKKKPKVKVTRAFRAKVEKSIAPHQIAGYHQVNYLESVLPNQINGQTVRSFPKHGLASGGYLFPAELILHAASRLWNTKLAVVAPGIGDALNFDATTSKIDVTRQWWTFRLKNNGNRTVQMKIFKCQPKNMQASSNAIDSWNNGLVDMFNTGTLRRTNSNLTADEQVSSSQLFVEPSISDAFRNAFTSEKIEITLEPGQKTSFNVQGPAMLYDFSKFRYNAQYQPVQKQDIHLIWCMNYDIVWNEGLAGNGDVYGRGTSVDISDAIIVESTYHCALKMPETALQAPVVAGVAVTAVGRKRRMVIDDFTLSGEQPQGNVVRTDELIGEQVLA